MPASSPEALKIETTMAYAWQGEAMWVLMRKPRTHWVNERPLPVCVWTSGPETKSDGITSADSCLELTWLFANTVIFICAISKLLLNFPCHLSLCICGYGLELPQDE